MRTKLSSFALLFAACGSGAATSQTLGTIVLSSGAARVGGAVQSSSKAEVVFGPRRPDDCQTTEAGACQVVVCPSTTAAPSPAPGPAPNTGAITFGGLLEPLVLTPGADGQYPPFIDDAHGLWNGGEPMTVSSTGATVPAVSAMISTPGQATFSSPTLTGSTLSVSRSADLNVAWSGGLGTVAVYVTGSDGVQTTTIRCDAPSGSGSWPIPATLLSRLPAGMGGAGFSTETRFTWTKDSSEIDFLALTNGVDGAGNSLGFIAASIQ